MAFELQPFLTNITQYGYTNPSKFDVLITNPLFMSGLQNFANIPSILQFRAEKVNTPTLMFLSNDSNTYGAGPILKQPYSAAMGDITLTFIADRESIIYSYFFNWMNYIYNFSDLYQAGASPFDSTANNTNFQAANYYTGFEDDYVAPQITINYYDNSGNNNQKIIAYRAKPMSLISTPLDWGSTNQFFRIVVGINYREWSLSIPNLVSSSQVGGNSRTNSGINN